MFYKFIYVIARFIFFFVYRMHIIGKENIPAGSAIICSNHPHNVDPILIKLAFGINENIVIMAKQELFKVPIFNVLIKKLGAFPVNRGKADVSAVKFAMHSLKKGDKLLIFPEGTRTKNVVDQDAKAGAGMFALRSNAPVLPVYISTNKPVFSKVNIIIGKPEYIKRDKDSKPDIEEYKQTANIIMKSILELGRGVEA